MKEPLTFYKYDDDLNEIKYTRVSSFEYDGKDYFVCYKNDNKEHFFVVRKHSDECYIDLEEFNNLPKTQRDNVNEKIRELKEKGITHSCPYIGKPIDLTKKKK